jgi:nucleotide-binding universal stress UspA family protein
MNKILAPTDFSEFANYAIEYAAFFAKKSGGTLYILTVLRSKAEEDYKLAEKKLAELKKLKNLKHVTVKTIIKVGDSIRDNILDAAAEADVDLIIMGSNGAALVSEILLGSNTEKVIRKSNFNVLTIKHQMISLRLDSIAFASDFSEESNDAFVVVKEMAKLFNSKIYLLKINTPGHFEPTRLSLEKVNKFIKTQKLDDVLGENKYEIALYSDSTEELGILNYCIENEIDLITVGTHGKRAIWKLFTESTSQNLVNHSFRPVLTIKI